MSQRTRGCARRASARACSRWSRRWTSWRWHVGSIRSSCASAMNLRSTPKPGVRSAAGAWSRAGAKAPSASAGPSATRSRARRDGPWLVGTGVAASTYPALQFPATALVQVDQAGNYQVRIDATDIGTGAWTVLTQIAADALEVPPERVQLEIGDSALPRAFMATGSTGTGSWGWAICNAATALRARLREEYGGVAPPRGRSGRRAVDPQPQAANVLLP